MKLTIDLDDRDSGMDEETVGSIIREQIRFCVTNEIRKWVKDIARSESPAAKKIIADAVKKDWRRVAKMLEEN